MNRAVNMLPPRLAADICSLIPGEARLTVSVVFEVDPQTGNVSDDPWIGKGVIKSAGKLSYDEVDAVITGSNDVKLHGATVEDIKSLHIIANRFRESRYSSRSANLPPLRLLHQLDDENVPVEHNIFDSSASHEIIEELSHKANAAIAQVIFASFPETAFLRRQSSPNPRRLQTFAQRMTKAGYKIDTSSSGALQNSLFSVKDTDLRKGMETLLIKTMPRAKYSVPKFETEQQLQHYALNLPLYAHFTNPSRRYADIVVHRQLEARN